MTSRSTNGRFPRWAFWLISLISTLAISILLLAIVLGVRAGQQQVELQRKQRVGIALQQAIESRTEENYTAALEQYRSALALDPNNQLAVEGVQSMLLALEQPSETASISATSVLTQTAPVSGSQIASTQSPTPTLSQANDGNKEALWVEAERALQAGRPQTTVDRLLQIQRLDANFRLQERQTMLFNAYIQLAGQQDSEDKLEQSLLSLENALTLRPNTTEIRREYDLLSTYLDMVSVYDTNWAEAIKLLQSLKQSDPTYRDVSKRLVDARVAFGDELLEEEPCQALPQFEAAITLIGATPFLNGKQSDARLACITFETAVALSGTVTATLSALGTPLAPNDSASTTTPLQPTTDLRGKILYSAADPNDGRLRIFAQNANNGAFPPTLLAEDASQPALRSDGQRLAFHNFRNDLGGISSIDPASGLQIRYTAFSEDVLPSWNANGGRIAFASTREGDRRWRIYLVWADQSSEAVEVGFGEAPAWHPSADLLAFRGCDQTGNNCGIWQMDGSGGNRLQLTSVQNDNRPDWSADERSVVFMSDSRSGNFDIFRVDSTTRQVLQLTDSAAFDMLPSVSPDGQWVAFVSNRDGAWKIYVVSINGGAERLLAPIRGNFGDWQMQKLDWVN